MKGIVNLPALTQRQTRTPALIREPRARVVATRPTLRAIEVSARPTHRRTCRSSAHNTERARSAYGDMRAIGAAGSGEMVDVLA